MFEKFNWGHGITLFYIIFVGAVITALVASFGVDRDLVADDYYAKDIAYQGQYEKMKNNLKSDNLSIVYKKEEHILDFSFTKSENVTGFIEFYRPSSKKEDFMKKIDQNRVIISTRDMSPGKWRVKVDWQEGRKSYYKEEEIYI